MPIHPFPYHKISNFSGLLLMNKYDEHIINKPSPDLNGEDKSETSLPLIEYTAACSFVYSSSNFCWEEISINLIREYCDEKSSLLYTQYRNMVSRVTHCEQKWKGKHKKPVKTTCASHSRDEIIVSVHSDMDSLLPPTLRDGDSDASDDGPKLSEAVHRPRGYAPLATGDIEPCPLLVLEPLLLVQGTMENHQQPVPRRRKEQLSPSEQQKVARIMIGYTLAFFLLAILTFYVVYFV
ncbi:hypothetical protein R5R35_001896 [Gryllus longicercus]|uniref:Uncharacterized protein n=1 Tax=Gryllus longicercus TaxID=2509291 RepID=A0AAN9ZB27_9ORTH